jgi:hypothetical protein
MPVVPVPDLRRKFALLRTYSPRTSWELLAEPFGASPKTLKYWGHGSATRAPDHIPPEALPVLRTLIADLVPAGYADDDIDPLLFGPVDRLEEVIRSGAASSFARLIARDGQTGTATLFRKRYEIALVEIEGEAAGPGIENVRLGALFRIEFPIRTGHRMALTLQGAQRAWAVVPSVIADHPARVVLMPGLESDQAPRFMRERRDTGLHQFVCLQAAEAFPALINEHRRDNAILDKRALDTLARFHEGLPATRRACHVLTLSIEPDHAP